MLKCKVCGKEFEAVKENHYIAREGIKTGALANLASNEEKIFDAFDCPYCGCQYIAGERKRSFIQDSNSINYCVGFSEEENKSEENPYCCENTLNDSEKYACFGEYEECACSNNKCTQKEECQKETNSKKPYCFGNHDDCSDECISCLCELECDENTRKVIKPKKSKKNEANKNEE